MDEHATRRAGTLLTGLIPLVQGVSRRLPGGEEPVRIAEVGVGGVPAEVLGTQPDAEVPRETAGPIPLTTGITRLTLVARRVEHGTAQL